MTFAEKVRPGRTYRAAGAAGEVSTCVVPSRSSERTATAIGCATYGLVGLGAVLLIGLWGPVGFGIVFASVLVSMVAVMVRWISSTNRVEAALRSGGAEQLAMLTRVAAPKASSLASSAVTAQGIGWIGRVDQIYRTGFRPTCYLVVGADALLLIRPTTFRMKSRLIEVGDNSVCLRREGPTLTRYGAGPWLAGTDFVWRAGSDADQLERMLVRHDWLIPDCGAAGRPQPPTSKTSPA